MPDETTALSAIVIDPPLLASGRMTRRECSESFNDGSRYLVLRSPGSNRVLIQVCEPADSTGRERVATVSFDCAVARQLARDIVHCTE